MEFILRGGGLFLFACHVISSGISPQCLNLIFNTLKRASLSRGPNVIVDLLLSCDDLFGLVFFVLASKDSNAMFYCKQTQPSVKKLSLSCDIRSFVRYFAISDWLS